jgi:hypothetical protein
MPKQRASIFEAGEQLDVSVFAPKASCSAAPRLPSMAPTSRWPASG